MDQGLLQKQIAEQVGVDATTVWNWESNTTSPQVHDMARIIVFLGYNPLSDPTSLAEKLLHTRQSLGLSQRAMANKLGIDPGTLGRLERGEGRRVFAGTRRKLTQLFKGEPHPGKPN